MKEELDDYNWKEVFSAAGVETGSNGIDLTRAIPTDTVTSLEPFGCDDVAEILHKEEGDNDGPDWIIVVKLKDGRFAYLEGGCDCTGWDCQSSCSAQVAATYEEIVRFGCSESARTRFNIEIDGEGVRHPAKETA